VDRAQCFPTFVEDALRAHLSSMDMYLLMPQVRARADRSRAMIAEIRNEQAAMQATVDASDPTRWLPRFRITQAR